MTRHINRLAVGTVALMGVACGSAYADRIAAPPHGGGQAIVVETPQPVYGFELLDERGRTLETMQRKGRFYILGRSGDRYSIRVTNPTDQRVEALISVDGLDVIDGETADFVNKRGYVVPPHGELKVDGFRVSTQQVAAFRFSAVENSYAERKGKGRNIGVIGVAIFEEKEAPQMILSERPRPRPRPHRGYTLDEDDYSGKDRRADRPAAANKRSKVGKAKRRPRPAPSDDMDFGEAEAPSLGGGAPAPVSTRPAPRPDRDPCCGVRPKSRPGLGTEFGERRHSAVSFTRFVRKNLKTPDATAELRYNDADGLASLGILSRPAVDPNELAIRESAESFPNSRFSAPPR
jgi:hypothetical protein